MAALSTMGLLLGSESVTLLPGQLAVVEAILGQRALTVLMARLVGFSMFVASESEPHD